MRKVHLDVPDRFDYATEVRLRVSDMNYGNHLGNDAVLALVHEARVRFLEEHGFKELEGDGTGLIMADAALIYRAQGHRGQSVRIEVAVKELGEVGFDLYYRLSDKQTGKEIALVKTGMAFFDYRTGELLEIPDRFRQRFEPSCVP